MSYIKQKHITTYSETATPLTYADMGDVVLAVSTPSTVVIPNATDAHGLWYRFINTTAYSCDVEDEDSSAIVTVASSSTEEVLSDGTDWIVVP